MKKILCILLFVCMTFCLLQAEVIFSEDFTGTGIWGFDHISDPGGKISGNGQLVYTSGATNQTAYLFKEIDGSTLFASGTGQLQLSYTLDTSNFNMNAGDYNVNTLVGIRTTDSGNRDPFTGSDGGMFDQGIAGYNSVGKTRVSQSLESRFNGGGGTSSDIFLFPSALQIDNIITVSGGGGSAWTMSYVTTITGLGGSTPDSPLIETGSYTFTDNSYYGLQSITGLAVGYLHSSLNEDIPLSPTNSISIDHLTFGVIPEPSSLLLIGMALGGMMIVHRRR
ncbi:PEP-CTERM sorting domain-containing protein [Kiritimatiellaeota bacterium B1221]|nr:PEP-CTERM sorting domain-containing protein [Kiritimatiellaeota bacterium B1221]